MKKKSNRILKLIKFDRHVPIIIIVLVVLFASYYIFNNQIGSLQTMIQNLNHEKDRTLSELEQIGKELSDLASQDQLAINRELMDEIGKINEAYNEAVGVYDDVVELRTRGVNTTNIDKELSKVIAWLSERKYEEAKGQVVKITEMVKAEEQKLIAAFSIPAAAPQSNTPPSQGYSRQTVNVEGLGQYLVSLVAGDISSTRVIVDTASDGDCGNDCPVLPLATYVSRSGAFAGINGTYFCPASYASCAGKTNSFDLLVMNKNKTYFNSDNNVYSNNPAAIFGDGYVRFVSAVSQWGRDTSVHGVVSNFPLLVFNGNVVFGGDDDPKKGSRAGRSFVAHKAGQVFIGVVHNATVAESARTLAAMGMENALNLDSGGSTALWSGGYKIGPGRDLPNAILFVNK